MGNAIRLACRELKGKMLLAAGAFLPIDPSRLVLAGGEILENGLKKLNLKGLAVRRREEDPLTGESAYSSVDSALLESAPGLKNMSSLFWSFSTPAIEVELDTGTGVLRGGAVSP